MYKKAILTADHLIRIAPQAHDLYLMCGMLREKTGDTTVAKTYFIKSLQICNAVLDTMNVKNTDYDMVSMNRAINITMLGDSTEGNLLLAQLYDRHKNDGWKDVITPFLNKGKNELIEEAFRK